MVEFRHSSGRPGRDEPPSPTLRVGVKVPLAWLPILQEIARARGLNRHALLREAIAEYLERHTPSGHPLP